MKITILACAGFLASVIGANYATTHWGMVHVGLGLYATAGTYLAGATFVLRDLIQDQAGKAVIAGLIVAGALVSMVLASPQIAVASGVAFLLSEAADLAVYTPLRRRGYIRAAVASNLVGSLVDTVVFLAIAGFPIWSSLPGQMAGKLAVTAAVVIIVAGVRRALPGQPVRS